MFRSNEVVLPAAHGHRRRFPGLPVLLTLGALAGGLLFSVGYLASLTAFARYDDEGYILLSIRDFVSGQALYDSVFTQYGPWPYQLSAVLKVVDPRLMTHDSARGLTSFLWTVTSLAGGGIAWILSRRAWVVAASVPATFGFLWITPMTIAHPGNLIAATLAVSLALSLALWSAGRSTFAAITLGVTCGALLLTKINVGGLLALSILTYFLAVDTSLRPWGRRLGLTLFALTPWVLMAANLRSGWVIPYCVAFGISGYLLVRWRGMEPVGPLPRLPWKPVALGCAGFLAAVTAATMSQGSTLWGVLDGVLLRPLLHPGSFAIPLEWSPAAWAFLGVLVGGAVWSRGGSKRTNPMADSLGVIRLLVAGMFVLGAGRWLSMEGLWALTVISIPLVPMMMAPLGPGPSARANPAMLLAGLIALGQILHFYPVAGAQMAWGSFLLIPLFATGIAEANEYLGRRFRVRWAFRHIVPASLVVVSWLQVVAYGAGALDRWTTREPLDLPGSARMRLAEDDRSALRILTANAIAHGEVLYSQPGLFSFNIWSGVPSPGNLNVTHWMWLLSDREQEAVVAALRAASRPVLIRNWELERFLEDLGVPLSGPLVEHIRSEYEELFRLHGYSFLLPHGAAAHPIGILRVSSSDRSGPGGSLRLEASVHLEGVPNRIVAKDLGEVSNRKGPPLLGLSNVSLVRSDIHEETGPALTSPAWGEPHSGLYVVGLDLPFSEPAHLPEGLVVSVLTSDGRSIAEARLPDP